MAIDRPAAGEELNEGPESPARQAASVMVLRESPAGPEVLLVERNPKARFMGGAWVFPGGSVHDSDPGHAGAALRELKEEAGVSLASADELLPFSRWITPSEVKIRFDTMFFLAAAPPDAVAVADGDECVDARWMTPADSLSASERGELSLVFPTIKHLEQLATFESVEAALAAARKREIVPVQPRIMMRDEGARVLLPGEPGYDAPTNR